MADEHGKIKIRENCIFTAENAVSVFQVFSAVFVLLFCGFIQTAGVDFGRNVQKLSFSAERTFSEKDIIEYYFHF